MFQQAVITLRQDLRSPFEAAARTQTADAFASTMRLATVVLVLLTLVSTVMLRPRDPSYQEPFTAADATSTDPDPTDPD